MKKRETPVDSQRLSQKLGNTVKDQILYDIRKGSILRYKKSSSNKNKEDVFIDVKTQADYHKYLCQTISGLGRFSTATLSRYMKKDLKCEIANGKVVFSSDAAAGQRATELYAILDEQQSSFMRVSDVLIYLKVGTKDMYRAKTIIKDTYSDFVLSMFYDDECNLMLLLNSTESANEIARLLREDFHLPEINAKVTE